jgi:hypothetical protein
MLPPPPTKNQTPKNKIWISRSAAEREVVVAFRGTETVKWQDVVADLNLIPQSLDAERTGAWDLNTGLGRLPMFKSFKRSESCGCFALVLVCFGLVFLFRGEGWPVDP